jgi:hypothetical protein
MPFDLERFTIDEIERYLGWMVEYRKAQEQAAKARR